MERNKMKLHLVKHDTADQIAANVFEQHNSSKTQNVICERSYFEMSPLFTTLKLYIRRNGDQLRNLVNSIEEPLS